MEDIKQLIEEHDESLSLLRKSFMEASPADKGKWSKMIDKSLDERLALMARRDQKPTLTGCASHE